MGRRWRLSHPTNGVVSRATRITQAQLGAWHRFTRSKNMDGQKHGWAKTWMGKKMGKRRFERTGSVLRLDFFAHTSFCQVKMSTTSSFCHSPLLLVPTPQTVELDLLSSVGKRTRGHSAYQIKHNVPWYDSQQKHEWAKRWGKDDLKEQGLCCVLIFLPTHLFAKSK